MNIASIFGVFIVLVMFGYGTAHAEVTAASDDLPLQRTLSMGTLGDDVRAVQLFLSDLIHAYPEALITGYFGRLTEAAVIRFQRQMGIEPVGIVGPKTRKSLNTLMLAAASASGQEHRSSRADPASPATPASSATPAIPATPNPGQGVATPAAPATPATPAQSGKSEPPPSDPTDITAPEISAVNAFASSTSARITWTTNEPATSAVLISLTPDFSATIASSTDAYTTSHILVVDGLAASSTYYFTVSSADASGNTTATATQTFSTMSALIPPQPILPTGELRITTDLATQDRPAIDGNYVVWTDYRYPGSSPGNIWNSDIFLYDLQAKVETRMTSPDADFQYQLFPSISGNNVVYVGRGPSINGLSSAHIYLREIIPTGTSSAERLVSNAAYRQTSPFIDGNSLVYVEDRGSGWNVVYRNLLTGVERLLSSGGSANGPNVSGNDIVWSDSTGGISKVYAYSLITGTTAVVTKHSGAQTKPYVSNGKIVMADRRAGTGALSWDVYVYDLASGIERRITPQSGTEPTNLTISDNRVMWTDTQDGGNIYAYDLASGMLSPFLVSSWQAYHPYVREDSVVWSDNRNGNHDIYYFGFPQ